MVVIMNIIVVILVLQCISAMISNGRFSLSLHRLSSLLNRSYKSPTLFVSSSSSLPSSYKDQILRKVDNWACVKNCGACCKLGNHHHHHYHLYNDNNHKYNNRHHYLRSFRE